jgi:hypothetical protein
MHTLLAAKAYFGRIGKHSNNVGSHADACAHAQPCMDENFFSVVIYLVTGGYTCVLP